MKLLIFMLAISLCIASPSLRRSLQKADLTDDEHPPTWLFGDADSEPTLFIDSAEEELENYPNEEEEMIPFPNEEEILPIPSEEEEEENNEQPLPDDNNNTQPNNPTDPTDPTTPNNGDSYVELQPSEIESSAEVQSILSYGIDAILKKGVASGKIPKSEYDITKMLSISRKIQNKKAYYSCSIELRDENQTLIKAQFTVSVNTSTQQKSLGSWAYQVNSKFSIDETAYKKLNKREIKYNREVKSCLDFAIEDVIANSEEFKLVAVNGVYTQRIKSTVYYKFDVKLDNHKGKTIDFVVTVAYKPAEGSRDVKAYSTKTTTLTHK